MAVQTETPRVEELRRRNLTTIMRRHPHTCLTCHRRERCGPFDICLRHAAVEERCILCPQNGACELQRAVDHVGLDDLPPYQSKKLPSAKTALSSSGITTCAYSVNDASGCATRLEAPAPSSGRYPCHRACPGRDRHSSLYPPGRAGQTFRFAGRDPREGPFPGVLGRVCIHPVRGGCQRGLEIDKPIADPYDQAVCC